MIKKYAVPGYRVAPMYCDGPNGTIIRQVDDLHVMVEWDVPGQDFKYGVTLFQDSMNIKKEQIKYLRKGI